MPPFNAASFYKYLAGPPRYLVSMNMLHSGYYQVALIAI